MADDEREEYTITLAQQIFGTAAAIAGHDPLEPKANDITEAQGTSIPVRDVAWVKVRHLPLRRKAKVKLSKGNSRRTQSLPR